MSTGALIKDTLENVAESGYFRSLEHTLSESPVGSALSGFLKDKVEPSIGRAAQIKIGTGMAADKAYYEATKEVHTAAFGSGKTSLIPILKAAEQQKGSIHATEMANALDIYFKDPKSVWRRIATSQGVSIGQNSIYDSAFGLNTSKLNKVEQTLKNQSGVWFLPRIAIPHAFQAPLNSAAVDGWAATAKAFKDLATDKVSTYNTVLKAGALSQELMYEFKQAQRGTSSFNKLLDPLRKTFSFERKWGIVLSGVAGKHAALDAADELLTSGGTSKRSILQLKVLGIDPAEVMSNKGLTAEHIDNAIYRSAGEVMGFRSPLEMPYRWEQNSAMRIMTAYKPFGFRQARLLKNSLTRTYEAEGYGGVMKQAASLGAAFFVAGELIKGIEGISMGENPWSKERNNEEFMHSEIIDGIAHAGGFGIAYSGIRSAGRNRLANYIVGPYISSAADIVQDAFNLRGKALGRDVLRKAGLPGSIVANTLLKSDKHHASHTTKKSSSGFHLP